MANETLRRRARAISLAGCAVITGCAPGPCPPAVAPVMWSPPPAAIAPSTPVAALPAPTSAGLLEARLDAPAPAAPPPQERHPFHEPLPSPLLDAAAPAVRYANMSSAECRQELRRRALPVLARKGSHGVAAPLRLEGPLRGVLFQAPRAPTPFGVLDCRLALTLDDFAEVLAVHRVTKVRIDNMYRPGARLPARHKSSQHHHGLAADIMAFELEGGTSLVVERDWHAAIGEPVCGPDASMTAPDEPSILLRTIVCEVARRGIFHHLLTPSFDAAHQDHLHLDIKRGGRTRSVR